MFEEYPDILSAGEALEALRVGENSLYRLLNSGKLKAYKNGRNWRSELLWRSRENALSQRDLQDESRGHRGKS